MILNDINITLCSVNSRLSWSVNSCSSGEGNMLQTAAINSSSLFVRLCGGMPCHVEVEISHCSENLKIRHQPSLRFDFTQGI